MFLRESPFPHSCLHGLHSISWALIFPCYWFLERFLASFLETSVEKKQRQGQRCSLCPLQVFLGSTMFLVLLVLSMPIALLGFIVWAPLQAVRRPFSYQRGQSQGFLNEWCAPEQGKSFIFVSANLCLLPGGLARFSNLSHTQRRSAKIAKNIVHGVTREMDKPYRSSLNNRILNHEILHTPLYGAIDPCPTENPQQRLNSFTPYGGGGENMNKDLFLTRNGKGEQATRSVDPVTILIDMGDEQPKGQHGQEDGGSLRGTTSVEEAGHSCSVDIDSFGSLTDSCGAPAVPDGLSRGAGGADGGTHCPISQLIPAGADFICLQEVFDKRAANRIATLLSPVFEHILYDVGVYGPLDCSDFKFFNSGLFLASRYHILSAQYRHYPNGSGEDALAAKGLLCVKVLIGINRGKRIVGYMNCTHLHAPEADGHVRCEQLTILLGWINEFQEWNTDPGDLIAFDVLCGDFNFDNCSTDDHREQKHEIFGRYNDPCRADARKDKDWAIGTLLQPRMLYDDAVNSPQRLQRTLEKEEGRRKYIAPPINPDGSPDESSTGAPWTGRRIDYILYREGKESGFKTDVEDFAFITHLAGLTDHLAVGLQLYVSSPTEEV